MQPHRLKHAIKLWNGITCPSVYKTDEQSRRDCRFAKRIYRIIKMYSKDRRYIITENQNSGALRITFTNYCE